MRFQSDETPLGMPASLLIRWGSRALGFIGARVINTIEAISLARDKQASRRLLNELAPKSWFTLEDIPTGLPCVVRPKYHHGGRHFYVCRTPMEMLEATRRCGMGWYASELIEKQAEYRVFILHGKVVAMSERTPGDPLQIIWNHTHGGHLHNMRRGEWPLEIIRTSLVAMDRLGLDWGAVDVALDMNDRAVVFEVNTAPNLTNTYTIAQIIRAFKWSASNEIPAKRRFPIRKWQHVIHPSLRAALQEALREGV